MKKILLPFFLLLLSSCVTADFSGKSITYGGDNILRNDVFDVVSLYEAALRPCGNITAVESSISDVKLIDNRVLAREIWKVTSCGKQHSYLIIMREDKKGETDVMVGPYEDKPAGKKK